MHVSYLRHRDFRWAKVALAALIAAIVLYAATRPPGGGNGGTPTGLALGVACAGLLVWLMVLGVRKRTHRADGAMLRGWVSAHVYLGLLLVVLVPIHSGFELGANVHSLAYALLCVVAVSGIGGVILYAAVPRQIAEVRGGEKLASLLERIDGLDAECKAAAARLPDEISTAVSQSIEDTRIGGSLTEQLRGRNPATRFALTRVRAAAQRLGDEHRDEVKRLVGLLALKQEMVERVEHDVRLKALLDLWLVVHVPFAFATVAAVIVHVWIVFDLR